MKHALVVGGTGMLSGVSLWLLEQGYHVSISKGKWELLHVLGSSSDLSKMKREITIHDGCLYNQVQLG